MHSIVVSLLSAQLAFAVVPAERAVRRQYVARRLLDLPLSSRTLADLRRTPGLEPLTVDEFLRWSPETRRASIAQQPWIEREIAREVARFELRLTLSPVEIERWVAEGRIPTPSLDSDPAAMPLGPATRRRLESHGCRTLGDVRREFLIPMVYATAPLTAALAREWREEFTQLPLPESEMVLRLPEARFAFALAEARLGKRARTALRERGIVTFRELRSLRLGEIEAERPLGKKTVKQIRALLRTACAKDLAEGS